VPDTLETIRTRRVAKSYAAEPVDDDLLWTILDAARWAPSGSNMRVLRFVLVTDPAAIRLIRIFSPGMVAGVPAALIVICVDRERADYPAPIPVRREVQWDVGCAAENMLLAAHALRLAAGPMTADAPSAMRVLLDRPDRLEPHLVIGIGHPGRPPVGDVTRKAGSARNRREDVVIVAPRPAVAGDGSGRGV
jgi:nitroreductase